MSRFGGQLVCSKFAVKNLNDFKRDPHVIGLGRYLQDIGGILEEEKGSPSMFWIRGTGLTYGVLSDDTFGHDLDGSVGKINMPSILSKHISRNCICKMLYCGSDGYDSMSATMIIITSRGYSMLDFCAPSNQGKPYLDVNEEINDMNFFMDSVRDISKPTHYKLS